MKCKYCGAELRDGATFCHECGRSIDDFINDPQILQFKTALLDCKAAYENYFNARDMHNYFLSLGSSLKKIITKYDSVKGRKMFYFCFALVNAAVALCCHLVKSGIKYDFVTLIKLQIACYVCSTITVIFFILFLIAYFFREKRLKRQYSNIIGKVSQSAILLLEIKNMDFENRDEVVSKIAKLANGPLHKKEQDTLSELNSTLPSLDGFITDDYQSYKHVCFFLRIINNHRADSLKEVINTMVSDYQKDELVQAIKSASSSLMSEISSLSKQVEKSTEALNKVSAAVVAGSAATAASVGYSNNNSAVRSQCLSCAKFSKCRNPYVYGCGAYVPK